MLTELLSEINRHLFTIILLLLPNWGIAQEWIYTNYNTNHGLTSSETYDIVQDKNGFIWFATDRGITRYDGYDFKKYGLKEGLTDITVFNFYEQPDGTFWCSTLNKKLFYYDPELEKFEEYCFNHLLSHENDGRIITDLYVENGTVYLIFNGHLGYLKIDSAGTVEDLTQFGLYHENAIIHSEPKKLGLTFLWSEELDRDKYITHTIPSSESKRHYYDVLYSEENDKCVIVKDNRFTIKGVSHSFEKSIGETKKIIMSGMYKDNYFWIGLRHGGVKIYDFNARLIEHLLPNSSATKLFEDHEGGFWISTLDSGVYYAKNGSIHHYTDHTLARSNNAVQLETNNEKQLYIGYLDGQVFKKDKDDFNLIFTSNMNNNMNVAYYSKENRLLVKPNFFKIWEEQKGELTSDFLNWILPDNSESSPIESQELVKKITYNDISRRYNRVHDVEPIQDSPLEYYIASPLGLKKFKNDSMYDLSNDHNLFSYRIEDIDGYNHGYYMASMGAGLIVMAKDSVFSIDTSKGLYSDLATEVFIENEREVYVATNTGLNKIHFNEDLSSYSVSGISTSRGLPSNEVNDIEVINDTVWVGTKNGLCSFHKSVLDNNFEKPPHSWLRIENVKVNKQEVANQDVLASLKHNENNISIHFNSISLRKGPNTEYQYRLLGAENEWNTTTSRFVEYPELQPGSYTFMIRRKPHNAEENIEIQKLQFYILPPFWKRWWFISLILLALALAIYSFFKVRILTYNRDILREFLRILLKKVNGKKYEIIIRESGNDIKLETSHIQYAKSSGNYLEIHTDNQKHLIREKISEFYDRLPDKMEFTRIHRSFLIRIDKVEAKNPKCVRIKGEEIPVGKSYRENLNRILF
ncbi:LytTR family transcriptional regulator DNA-binding domain-containing protein [Aureisphaera galaxeae]|uniref:LytTR family transcriptional regulator DNA-binding domain-containing protein n=1 Tax=Aureisphaera galaxeae TaxID=1538023 RepID=UPI00235064C5|nr:LytTR family transcriptional regulator DNA-binding domain-containing protein [Aureisphaera galaxeae]MDC8002591.1 LytTR family transcriptional regulator DNA-binding domain-containing protein [Aureisphaera galaxeae]